MSNVKAGQLAIIIGGFATPEMIGMIVTVERLAISGEVLEGIICDPNNGGINWICSSSNVIPWRTSIGLRYVKKRMIGDELLKPVSGLPDEQTEEESNKLEV